jgi:hypothetical protein
MKKNVGTADSYIRFLAGISFLLNIIILKPGFFGTVILLVLGCAMLYSAATGFCWMYGLLKLKSCNETCEVEKQA